MAQGKRLALGGIVESATQMQNSRAISADMSAAQIKQNFTITFAHGTIKTLHAVLLHHRLLH